MDNEVIERLSNILMKHNPQTKIGAAIVVVELLTAMREPTEKMIAGAIYESSNDNAWRAMIDAVIND